MGKRYFIPENETLGPLTLIKKKNMVSNRIQVLKVAKRDNEVAKK